MPEDPWGKPTFPLPLAPDYVPAPGSVVGLLPAPLPGRAVTLGTGVLAATLREWHNEPGGVSVVADVSADPATIKAVSGRHVWGSFSTPAEALIIVAALARERPAAAGQLELTGVRMIAYEPRRRSVRAGLGRRVWLRCGGLTHEATTLDLSRGGCRVFTRDPGDVSDPGAPRNLSPGYELAIELELGEGLLLEADALVVRADGPELALRFTGLTATDAAEVDAAVFRELVRADG